MPTLTEVVNGFLDHAELLKNPDYRYLELIQGRPRLLPLPMGAERGQAVARFTMYWGVEVVRQQRGICYAANTGFHFKWHGSTVKSPDFSFVSASTTRRTRGMGFVEATPDLVIESGQDELTPARIREWLFFKVKYVINLDTKNKVMIVHRPDHEPITLTYDDVFTAEDILPGFVLPMTKVFPTHE
ncbi:MAG: Uma2 family endonuclease [Armatimonadetes bacterium]|nr:Uma2 family endonuclease [Armatimonadota bacterium]